MARTVKFWTLGSNRPNSGRFLSVPCTVPSALSVPPSSCWTVPSEPCLSSTPSSYWTVPSVSHPHVTPSSYWTVTSVRGSHRPSLGRFIGRTLHRPVIGRSPLCHTLVGQGPVIGRSQCLARTAKSWMLGSNRPNSGRFFSSTARHSLLCPQCATVQLLDGSLCAVPQLDTVRLLDAWLALSKTWTLYWSCLAPSSYRTLG